MTQTARRKILVIGTRSSLAEDIMDYSVHLGARIGHDLVALIVDTEWEGQRFRSRLEASGKVFKQKAGAQGINFEIILKQGDIATAINEINRKEKRIEFAVADENIVGEVVARHIAVPVFTVSNPSIGKKGGISMAGKPFGSKKKAVLSTIGFGILSAGLYAGFFSNSTRLMDLFTRGGVYAALPIVTALVFSFAHSTFASNAYSLMGLEAAKKGALRVAEKKAIQKQKKIQKKPRVRARASINPFHRF